MILRVKLLSPGKDGDSYRVNLPTYNLLHGNISKGYAIVAVPDGIHGLSGDDLKHETIEETTEGPLYSSLCADCLKKVHANFDQTYQEHRGKFRIELAP